mmetsp:Transcript_31008/g.63436  ORF Transcript_31008/g.63436 Transcript_31008/m.63436 type:complete len:228 (+) Transcript_31008:313-996(+)
MGKEGVVRPMARLSPPSPPRPPPVSLRHLPHASHRTRPLRQIDARNHGPIDEGHLQGGGAEPRTRFGGWGDEGTDVARVSLGQRRGVRGRLFGQSGSFDLGVLVPPSSEKVEKDRGTEEEEGGTGGGQEGRFRQGEIHEIFEPGQNRRRRGTRGGGGRRRRRRNRRGGRHDAVLGGAIVSAFRLEVRGAGGRVVRGGAGKSGVPRMGDPGGDQRRGRTGGSGARVIE